MHDKFGIACVQVCHKGSEFLSGVFIVGIRHNLFHIWQSFEVASRLHEVIFLFSIFIVDFADFIMVHSKEEGTQASELKLVIAVFFEQFKVHFLQIGIETKEF